MRRSWELREREEEESSGEDRGGRWGYLWRKLRERGHVECGGKGQTTGVLGYVYVRKGHGGSQTHWLALLCWPSKWQNGPSFSVTPLIPHFKILQNFPYPSNQFYLSMKKHNKPTGEHAAVYMSDVAWAWVEVPSWSTRLVPSKSHTLVLSEFHISYRF